MLAQPQLIQGALSPGDVVYTPPELACDMVDYFRPGGVCLDPCAGGGVFLDYLPANSHWCEIEKGRDFYGWTNEVDWSFGNPPYSQYSKWMRHSMSIAKNIVYVMPVYKIFASNKFLRDLFEWGGIVHIRGYGTGTDWGFPFGHALSAVHYKKGYTGPTSWSWYK